jgi:O-acetyl-ADP-ribose deacetylase
MKNIKIKTADITKEKVCAIVNAANSSLMGGGGVDGAIHRAGGETILKEGKKIRKDIYPDGLPTGEAVSTSAGDMPSKYVIHTVGPVYGSCPKNREKLLKNCYINSLKEVLKLGCDSIAFPAISTGIYGYPKEEAAKIAFDTVKKFLEQNPAVTVYFVFSSDTNKEIFEKANSL